MSRLQRARARVSGRYAVATALVLVLGVPAGAVAFGEGNPLRGGKRNPSSNAARAYTAETEIIADNGTYATRQSNKGAGGAAIYGCRSAPGSEACLRANNLQGGRAFEYSSAGNEGGRIDLANPAGAPLTTNATGVATGFNADRIDGRDGAELAATADFLTAVVAANGALASGRGATAAALVSNAGDNFRVTFNRDVARCAYTVSPVGVPSAEAFGVRPAPDNATQVIVNQPDGGAQRSFHLQVVC